MPWKLAITAILWTVITRPLFENTSDGNLEYLLFAVLFGACLGIVDHLFNLGIVPRGKNEKE